MKKDENNERSQKEEALNSDELNLVRSRYEQLDDDRSKIPPPNQKEDSKLVKLIKKNKLASAVIFILTFAVILSVILLCVYSATASPKENTDDYLFFFGEEEIKYKNERIVINGVLYVDMVKLASYAELSYSGSNNTMKYIASEGEYIKFTNESEYAVINGTKVVIPAPAYVDSTKCIVPYSVISKAVSGGISFELGEKNTVKIERTTYEQEDIVYFYDVTFTPSAFRAVTAMKDVSNITFEYPDGLSGYIKYMEPDDASEYLLLVNADNPLGESYTPSDLFKLPQSITALGESYYLRECAARSLIAMMKSLEKYDVYVTSAYRDYAYQEMIFEQYIKKYTDIGYTREQAEQTVRKTSALPGTSEHQSGLCVDFMTNSMTDLNNSFEGTSAFKWLSENAYKYGFILRYPKDKTDVTKYNYESWHYRYVGRDAAAKIYFSGLCLEEYLELV